MKATQPESVLLLGPDNQALLAAVRSLGRRGVDVHLGWCAPDSPSAHSRYVVQSHDVPSYQSDGPWVPGLNSLVNERRFNLVLPVSERAVLALAKARGDLQAPERYWLPNADSMRSFFDKAATHELARTLGVLVPEQLEVSTLGEGRDAARTLGWPLVLKPRSSYDSDRLYQRRSVRKVYGTDELVSALETMLAHGAVLAQRHVAGEAIGVEVLARNGKVLFAFQHRRLHQPPRGGGSSYRESMTLDGALARVARQLLDATGYTGAAMVEFVRSRDAGVAWLMEVNARFWGSMPLAVASGADFPLLLYRMLVHGEVPRSGKYATGVRARNLIGDVKWSLQNLRADRADATLATEPLSTMVRGWGRALTGRDHIDSWDWRDPSPAFVDATRYVRRFVSVGTRHATLAFAKRVLRRRGEGQRLRAALAKANHIVFVCKGNICRSPFAAKAMARSLPATVRVESTGYYPAEGRRAPPEAIAAANELDVDLAGHRSTRITLALAESADVLITFDEEIHREITQRFSGAREKLFRLSSLDFCSALEVRDPFGGDLPTFRACYEHISTLLAHVSGESA